MNKKTIAIVGMALILGICIWWWLGTSEDITVSRKLKIVEPSIKYSGNVLVFSIKNGLGLNITDAHISLSGDCTVNSRPLSSDGKMYNGEVSSEDITRCKAKPPGQSFAVDLTIEYLVNVGGIVTRHTEIGTIRGVVE